MITDVSSEKKALRQRFKAYRAQLTDEAYARHSATIRDRLSSLSALTAAHTVHVYWPIAAKREVDTRPLIEALWEAGKQIVMPVVASFAKVPTPGLDHFAYEGPACLQQNRWGLFEPCGTRRVSTETIDVVLVPALGAGRNGHRIGYGFGHYDSFLRDVDAPTIGLLYAACLVEQVPPEEHDVPLSILVTEDEVFRVPQA